MRKAPGIRIVGIESVSRTIVAPLKEEVLQQDDSVIVVGNTEQLKRFIRLL